MVSTNLVVNERYELIQVVGRGGHGVVYRALDRRKNTPVAVKVLSPGAATEPSMVERMVREQQAMVALGGTGAVSALDLCRLESGALCLVMEWLEGEDLERHLAGLARAGKRLEMSRVLQIVGVLAHTLDRAHGLGIVHRDVKPANVFLTLSGEVRLLDFGLSRMQSSATLTAAGIVMGSPSYIAPETWAGDSKQIDHRADLYSLGVIAFESLAGRVPFDVGPLVELLELVTTGKRPSLHALRPDLPPAIDGWVDQALAIKPSSRFNTGLALVNALSSVLGESALTPDAATDEVATASKRKSTIAAAWAAAAAMLKRLTTPKARKAQPSTPEISPPEPDSGERVTPSAPTPAAIPIRPVPQIAIAAGPRGLPQDDDGDRKSYVSDWLASAPLDLAAAEGTAGTDVVTWLGGKPRKRAKPGKARKPPKARKPTKARKPKKPRRPAKAAKARKPAKQAPTKSSNPKRRRKRQRVR